jgi:hypothetical protein
VIVHAAYDRDGRQVVFTPRPDVDDFVRLAERLREERASAAEVRAFLDVYREMRHGGGCAA